MPTAGARGFTLLELLVVLTILSVTAAVAVPAFTIEVDDPGREPTELGRLLASARATALERGLWVEVHLDETTGNYRVRAEGDELQRGRVRLPTEGRSRDSVQRITFSPFDRAQDRFAPRPSKRGDHALP